MLETHNNNSAKESRLSSTARMLIEFTQDHFEAARNLPNDNPALLQATIIYSTLKRAALKSAAFQELDTILADIDSTIATLRSSNAPNSKINADAFLRERETLAEQVKNLNGRGDSLLSRFATLETSVFNTTHTVLTTVANLDTAEQHEKSRSPEIESSLKKAMKEKSEFEIQQGKFLDECKTTSERLEKLHNRIYTTLPDSTKPSAPAPGTTQLRLNS